MALLTGNFPESAEIKLRHFDLWRYFEWGVYGNEATDRHDLLPIAIQRHLDRGAPSIDPADVIIVGDTPHDVSCAHRGGAKAIAVATGNFTLDALSGCRPEVLVRDLSDHAPFFALLDRQTLMRSGVVGKRWLRRWRKRLGVEPSSPAWRGTTDFEDREGHRAPFASKAQWYPRGGRCVNVAPRVVNGRAGGRETSGSTRER